MSLLCIIRSQHLLLLLIAHLVTSFFLIYLRKNKISIVTEILLSFLTFWYHNSSFSLPILLYYIIEYIIFKILLLITIWISKNFAFYVLVAVTHEKHKLHKFFNSKKRFKKFQARIWNRIDYGIKIKKGLPSMVGRKNKTTGVSFDKNGFPKFNAIATIKLDRKYWKKDRDVHFYHASKLLYEKIKKSSRLKSKFTKKEILEFKSGNLPDKYTWHHHQDSGVLQLVNRDTHAKVKHNGGYSIWGKGN